MKYEIHFDALNANGAVVGTGAFCITTSYKLDTDGKEPAFKRMCVEYARLTGIKCSDVRITDMDVRPVGTARR